MAKFSRIIFLLSLSCAHWGWAHNEASDKNLEESVDYFCRKPKNTLSDFVSTLSHGVVDAGSKLFEAAKRVASGAADGVGIFAHYSNAALDVIDPNALAAIAKAAADVGKFSAPILGALIGVEIPTGAFDKISKYSTPDNAALALAMARGLTGATEAVFYDDPKKELTNVETAGEVVKNAADTVNALSEYLIKNKGKISKNEEDEIKKSIQEGMKLLETVR